MEARPEGHAVSYGPFHSEREANATPPAQRARAESDARYPEMGPGCQVAPNAQIIFDACEAAGVELGEWDQRVITGLGNWETFVSMVVGDVITRAYEAGQAKALEGFTAEYSLVVGNRQPPRRIHSLNSDDTLTRSGLEKAAGEYWARGISSTVECRQVGPWKEVPDA